MRRDHHHFHDRGDHCHDRRNRHYHPDRWQHHHGQRRPRKPAARSRSASWHRSPERWPRSACRTSTAPTGRPRPSATASVRRRQDAQGHHHRPGQPVRLQPGRPGDRRPDQQRQGRHDRGGVDPGHYGAGLRPGRGSGTPCLTVRLPRGNRGSARGAQGNLDASLKWTYHVFWGAEDVARPCSMPGRTSRPTKSSR